MTGISPNDGVGDLEGEISAADLAAESPGGDARTATATLREGSDDSLESFLQEVENEAAGGKPEAEEKPAAEEKPPAEGEEKPTVEPTGEEKPADEEKPDGDEKPAGEDEGHALVVPMLDGESGDTLTIEGLPQEYHDQMQGHLKRSARIPELEGRIDNLRDFQAVAAFVDEQPLSAMLNIDKTDKKADAPAGVGEKFTQLWLLRNPTAALNMIERMGLGDPEAVDAEKLKLRAENAEMKTDQAIQEGMDAQQGTVVRQQFIDEAEAVILSVMAELKLNDGDAADFKEVAGTRLGRVFRERSGKGQDPKMNRAQMLTEIQPVLRRFATTSKQRGGGDKETPADATKRMQRTHDVSRRTRAVTGGTEISGPLSTSAEQLLLKKVKGVKGVKAASQAALRD